MKFSIFKNEDFFLHFRFAESWEISASTVPRVGSRFLSRRNLWRSYLAWPGTGKVGHEKIPANDFRLFFLDFFSTSATPHRKLSMWSVSLPKHLLRLNVIWRFLKEKPVRCRTTVHRSIISHTVRCSQALSTFNGFWVHINIIFLPFVHQVSSRRSCYSPAK